MLRVSRLVRASLAFVLVAFSAAALAQAYPAKTIRFILPFPPGGSTDVVGRGIAQKLSEQFGHQVVADNRPGAGGNLGLELAAKALPDGYTMVLSSPSSRSARRSTPSSTTIRRRILRRSRWWA